MVDDEHTATYQAQLLEMPVGIWFPVVRAHTGTDVFTEQLAKGIEKLGFKAEITWLPHRVEYAPWSVSVPVPPSWANMVHVNSWLSTRFLPSNLPIVTTIHHSIHDPRLLPYKGAPRALYHRYWIQHLERANLRRADAIVAVSADAAMQAERVFGPGKIRVIYNGFDACGISLQPRTAPNKPFRLIYVGTWMTRKGVDLFSEILQQLGPGFELLCVGGMPDRQERVSLPDNIKLLGRINDRNDLISLMQQSDALLFPSRSEGLSLSLIEAQACGLPVIASDCSSIPEVVSDGETGALCPVDGATAFAEAARGLANNRLQWQSMRAAAHSRAVTQFSLDRQVSEYADIYLSLIGSKE